MGTNFGEQEVNINSQLFNESSKFSFIQAIRLLDLESKHQEELFEHKVRTKARLSLDFPNSDIVSIEKKDDFITLIVTFMGLYGESSPLPTFYTETLLEEQREDKSVMRDFIDIFNIPIYQAYFKVWQKNQLGIRLNEFHDSKVLNLLHTFSGMPTKELRETYQDRYNMLKYAGLNMQYPRSAQALRTLVSDIIDYDEVEIIECIEQMVSIPKHQRCLLGEENSRLDDNLHLGDKIKDRMGKFRILVGDLDMKTFNELLPKREKFISLVEGVKIYIGDTLSWDLQLLLREDAYAPISLGASNESQLGLNTWLGTNEKVRTLFLDKNQYKVD